MPAPINESYQYSNSTQSTQTLTFTAATAGKLLVAAVAYDKAAGSGITVTSGWTKIAQANSGTNVTLCVAYKIADGGETSVSFTSVNARMWTGWVAEFDAEALDVYTTANSANLVVTSQTSGTTATTADADSMALAFFASDSKSATDAGVSFTNSFTLESTDPGGVATDNAGIYVARKELSATGTQETTFSTTGGGDQICALIAVFPNAASGVTGTATFTEGADTVSASGTVQTVITGTAAFTEGADTANAAGNVVISGTASITESADTVSASGTVSGGGVAGSASITEGADTVSASGTVQTVITGTASQVEAADTVSASGNVVFIGSAAITEGADTITASGSAASPVTGTVSITEEGDTVEATDFVAMDINGFYMIDGYTRQIIVVDSLLEAIEAASTRSEARANMQAWFAARRIDATAYKLNAQELKALGQLVN